MGQNNLKRDILLFSFSAIIAFLIFLLRFFGTISIIVDIFFAVFAGSVVVLIKNTIVYFRYQEHQRGNLGKSTIVFSITALFGLTLTCLLAAILN